MQVKQPNQREGSIHPTVSNALHADSVQPLNDGNDSRTKVRHIFVRDFGLGAVDMFFVFLWGTLVVENEGILHMHYWLMLHFTTVYVF